MALQPITPGSLVFGDVEGPPPQPRARLAAVHPRRRALRPGARDTASRSEAHARHAVCSRASRVHVVSQRLGHALPRVTMTTYAHVLPGNQRDVANTFARLVREARGA